MTSIRVDRLSSQFKRRAADRALSGLRALSEGSEQEDLGAAPACLDVLAALARELGSNAAAVRETVAGLWRALVDGFYVPGESKWCLRFLESLFELTAILLPGYERNARSALLSDAWSASVAASARDPATCLLFTRLLEKAEEGEKGEVFWRDLLTAAGSDALLELRCLLLLRKRARSAQSLRSAEVIGEAMTDKVGELSYYSHYLRHCRHTEWRKS